MYDTPRREEARCYNNNLGGAWRIPEGSAHSRGGDVIDQRLMERFYAFANWCYANWLPLFVIPFGLVFLGFFAYRFVTEPPSEVRFARKLERERISSELVEEIKAFELPPVTKLIELGEYTKMEGFYIYRRKIRDRTFK